MAHREFYGADHMEIRMDKKVIDLIHGTAQCIFHGNDSIVVESGLNTLEDLGERPAWKRDQPAFPEDRCLFAIGPVFSLKGDEIVPIVLKPLALVNDLVVDFFYKSGLNEPWLAILQSVQELLLSVDILNLVLEGGCHQDLFHPGVQKLQYLAINAVDFFPDLFQIHDVPR
jgi:hypothetical protein